MLRSTKELRGYTIEARDGDIGKVHEFYFDDLTWTIRYLVVETGNWLSERKVLITPLVAGQPSVGSDRLPVALTKEQVKASPDIDTDKPISRQLEIEIHDFYSVPYYWGYGMVTIAPTKTGTALAEMEKRKAAENEEEGDPHLRSSRTVNGYHIEATDGEIGHIEDFIVDDEKWMIRYLAIDTRNWLPGGRKVIISPLWADRVDWAESKVYFDLTQQQIKSCPEYDPSAPVNREYEKVLYDYYGRPRYWIHEEKPPSSK